MSAIPRTTTESLHYGDHRWAIRVNGAGESHWSMSHGPENIYSDRRCNFCCSSVAPPVASLHGVASYDRRLDGADVGKLDCFRRSGRLELLRIKTPHAASLIAASCPCCAALKIGSKCLCWVNRVVSSVLLRLPLFTQVQTYHCIALIDASGHNRKYRLRPRSLPNPGRRQLAARQGRRSRTDSNCVYVDPDQHVASILPTAFIKITNVLRPQLRQKEKSDSRIRSSNSPAFSTGFHSPPQSTI